MEVDGDVIAFAPQLAAEVDIESEPGESRYAFGNDDLIESGISLDDGSRGRLDEIAEMRVRKSLAQGLNGRRREDDVANLSKPNQQDLQSNASTI